MRITLIQGAFLPVPALRGGAVEKMWAMLGAEFSSRGHDVTHVSRLYDGLSPAENEAGVRHQRVRGYDRPRSRMLQYLQDFLYSRRAVRSAPSADIVVTNTFWAPMLLQRRHGAICVDVQRMPKGQLRLYQRAARLRANSSAVQEAISEEAPSLAHRVRVIPNPLPFIPGRPVDWSRKTKTILFAGRLHPDKGLEILLQAWSEARSSGAFEGWQLMLAGPVSVAEGGGGERWWESLQRSFPAADAAWRGPVHNPAQLNALYEQASVFVYPSLAKRGETFGQAILEAMSWGAVPVVSDLACFRDFVVNEQNGLVFGPATQNSIPALTTALRQAISDEARSWATRATEVRVTHSSSAIADLFLEDFSQLLRLRDAAR